MYNGDLIRQLESSANFDGYLPGFEYDESYVSGFGFENTVALIKELAEEKKISATEKTLIVEVGGKTYIRTKELDLCRQLDIIAGIETYNFKEIKKEEFYKITMTVKVPEQSFGAESLGKWRVGF